MSLGNTFENDLAKLILNAVAIANLADNAASSPLTNLYISLHTADPGEAGDQTTSEATYGAYARVAVLRSSSGWTVTANVGVNLAEVLFPEATSGSNTLTYAAIGTASSGAGKLIVSGILGASRVVTTGIAPRFAASQLTFTFD